MKPSITKTHRKDCRCEACLNPDEVIDAEILAEGIRDAGRIIADSLGLILEGQTVAGGLYSIAESLDRLTKAVNERSEQLKEIRSVGNRIGGEVWPS